MPQEARRFSDAELEQLRQDFYTHTTEEDKRWDHLAEMAEKNSEDIRRLTTAIEHQAQSTADIVRLYRDAQGATRIGRGVVGLASWVIGLGAAFSAVWFAIKSLGK